MDQKLMREFVEKKLKRVGIRILLQQISLWCMDQRGYEAVCSLSVRMIQISWQPIRGELIG